MLRTSRVHPKLSAFHVLEGQYDFNRVPFGPPRKRGTIFNPPEKEDPMDKGNWTAGMLAQHETITAACMFKYHQQVDTEHPLNTSCTPHMSKYRGKTQCTGL